MRFSGAGGGNPFRDPLRSAQKPSAPPGLGAGQNQMPRRDTAAEAMDLVSRLIVACDPAEASPRFECGFRHRAPRPAKASLWKAARLLRVR